MSKKIKSTSEKFIESLSPQELKKFQEGYKNFALSELILALMAQDEISVRKLAKIAGVSPTIVQEMRSRLEKNYSMESFYKILKSLGFNQFMVGHLVRNPEFFPEFKTQLTPKVNVCSPLIQLRDLNSNNEASMISIVGIPSAYRPEMIKGIVEKFSSTSTI